MRQALWSAGVVAMVAVAQPLAAVEPAGEGEAVAGAPAEPGWSLTLIPPRLAESELGRQLLLHVEQQGYREHFDQMIEVLGFDPRTEVRQIELSGNRPDPADAVAIVTLESTTGNLEGLALAMPGYESTEQDGWTIHSGLAEDGRRVYAAVRQKDGAPHPVVVLATDRGRLGEALAAGPETSEQEPDAFALLRVRQSMLSRLAELDRHANVVSMVRDAALRISETAGVLRAALDIEVINEDRAEQVRQLIQGVLAATQLPIEDAEFQRMSALTRGVTISREGSRVTCVLERPSAELLRQLTPPHGS